jgi:hypothetical protein
MAWKRTRRHGSDVDRPARAFSSEDWCNEGVDETRRAPLSQVGQAGLLTAQHLSFTHARARVGQDRYRSDQNSHIPE